MKNIRFIPIVIGMFLTAGIAALIITAGSVSGTHSPNPAQWAFNDVPEGHPYRYDVQFVFDNHFMFGYADGTFRPDIPITERQKQVLVERHQRQGGHRLWRLPDSDLTRGEAAHDLRRQWVLYGDEEPPPLWGQPNIYPPATSATTTTTTSATGSINEPATTTSTSIAPSTTTTTSEPEREPGIKYQAIFRGGNGQDGVPLDFYVLSETRYGLQNDVIFQIRNEVLINPWADNPPRWVEANNWTQFRPGYATYRIKHPFPFVRYRSYIRMRLAGTWEFIGETETFEGAVPPDNTRRKPTMKLRPAGSEVVANKVCEDTGTFNVSVTLNKPFHLPITADWIIYDRNPDFRPEGNVIPASGALRFEPGEMTKTITATIPDNDDEDYGPHPQAQEHRYRPQYETRAEWVLIVRHIYNADPYAIQGYYYTEDDEQWHYNRPLGRECQNQLR